MPDDTIEALRGLIRRGFRRATEQSKRRRALRIAEQAVLNRALHWQAQGARTKWSAHHSVRLWDAVEAYKKELGED